MLILEEFEEKKCIFLFSWCQIFRRCVRKLFNDDLKKKKKIFVGWTDGQALE